MNDRSGVGLLIVIAVIATILWVLIGHSLDNRDPCEGTYKGVCTHETRP